MFESMSTAVPAAVSGAQIAVIAQNSNRSDYHSLDSRTPFTRPPKIHVLSESLQMVERKTKQAARVKKSRDKRKKSERVRQWTSDETSDSVGLDT